ncbi:MAG: PorT family protein [Prevotellaceae bacterium]|jgi:hypothetical protein|nr:PorT family protein [Prevotellaceae bacterium]
MLKIKYVILIFLFPFSVFAQQKFEKEVAFGGNSGVTLSKMSFVPSLKQNYRLGYNGGLSLRFISEKYFGLQTELNFSQRGWESDTILAPRTLNYIELPFLTHLTFGQKKLRVIIHLGPKISYFLSDDSDIKYKFDYGICGGGGLELRTRKLSYVLEGRYYFGLSDIFPNGKGDEFSRSSNQDISVGLTVLWNK